MKSYCKKFFALIGILATFICSVAPCYIAYASDQEPQDQSVTSDDNIVQKILNFGESCWGAINRPANQDYISKLTSETENRMKETIASLFNGGGIYIDSNGDYVFTNEASQQLFDSMMNNSNVDAKVISDFSDFSYYADGYVNAQYIADCNTITAWAKDTSDGTSTGDYILYCARYYANSYIYTYLVAYKLPQDFSFISISPINSSTYWIKSYNTSSSNIAMPMYQCRYKYSISSATYTRDLFSTGSYGVLNIFGNNDRFDSSQKDGVFNSFPYFLNYSSTTINNQLFSYNCNYYCNNSLIFSKDVTAGTGLNNQTNGIYASYKNIGTINKSVIEENNWESIYNNYVTQVNIDYSEDSSMSSSDLRKIMKKYTSSIVDAIQNGSQNIEETISISNRYLQAISTDVRNISDQLSDLANGGSPGGGMTDEQYNSIMGKLQDIDDNAVDIASSTATISSDIDAIYEDTHGISDDIGILLENTADTNTNLVAIHTLLNNINSKIRDRNHDNPLPDDNFWMLLDDELDDYTDTFMDSLMFKLQMIGTVLQGVVPFGYVAVIGAMLNALAVQPEEPTFEIGLNCDSTTIPVHFNGTIDLSWVDDIMPMVRAFEVLLFILGLIWASFTIFTTLGSLFG